MDRFTTVREKSLCCFRALVDASRANPARCPSLIDALDQTVTEIERQAAVIR